MTQREHYISGGTEKITNKKKRPPRRLRSRRRCSGPATVDRILVIIGGCVVPLRCRHLGRCGDLVHGRGRGRQIRHVVRDLVSLSLVAMPEGACKKSTRRPASLGAG